MNNNRLGYTYGQLRYAGSIKITKMSDPARCNYPRGARGVGGLTCGLELELKLNDRTGVTNKRFEIVDQAFLSFFPTARTFV